MHNSHESRTQSLPELLARIAVLEAELAQVTQAKARLESQLTHTEELSQGGSWEGNPRTGEAYWSPGIYRMFGLDPNKFIPRHRAFLEFIHPEDRPAVERALANALAGDGGTYTCTVRMIRTDGEVRIMRAQGTVVFDRNGTAERIYGVARDITDEETARQALATSEQRFRLIAETVEDGFWVSTPGMTEILYANPAYEGIWGRGREHFDAYPEAFLERVHRDDRARLKQALQDHAQGHWRCEYRAVRPDGAVRWVAEHGYPVYDKHGELTLLTGVARDITDQRRAQEHLEHALQELRLAKAESERLMLQDPLTGTANRRYLHMFLEREWRREHRDARPISLLLLDIDYFKSYNDYYGHLRGDDCLQEVASRLSQTLQRPGDLLARFGGEEFLVVLPDTTREGAQHVAETLRDAVDNLLIPHAHSRIASHVTISVGATCVDPRTTSSREATHQADQALYEAKRRGRNRIVVVGEPD